MLIAYSVTPGYVSFRSTVHGSWFIQTICEVFQQHAKDKDICWLLTKVWNLSSILVPLFNLISSEKTINFVVTGLAILKYSISKERKKYNLD